MNSDICRDMYATNITLIADLDVVRDDLSIKVRVINYWKHMSFYNKHEICSIELILVDEQNMSQGFRTYKERRNPSYNEELMARRSLRQNRHDTGKHK
uniref:Uncharacterized protein n=1 Tax=Lactuca sativa TaxID=4236 RepID=A0A9R1VQ40_LACSA|nr:hypothetical protein LSAT_V11C400209490 [Lactuca sativa]